MKESDVSRQLAEQFLEALVANDVRKYEEIIDEDATMRLYRWDGLETYRPRELLIGRLMEEWSAWRDPTLQSWKILSDQERVAVEFRIQATENQRYVEHNRSVFLTIKEKQVQSIDLYCSEPLPSARRKGWIAPATLTEHELNRLLDSNQYSYEIRDGIPRQTTGYLNLRLRQLGFGDAHPSSNRVSGARLREEEADAKIKELVEYYRQKDYGFCWLVEAYDTPADLSQRLEQHGFILAGEQAVMARLGLDELDIPSNPKIEIELLDGSNDDSIEALLQINAQCFKLTKEQLEKRRTFIVERLKNPALRHKEMRYLARLDNKPVAFGQLILEGSMAYLGGAATLPGYRGQKIYSTLLKRRLEDARAQGYQIAMIDAQPMSRRIVAGYGFNEYAKSYLYAWMPVPDMQLIRSLVQTE